jgi:hypothetical protein
VMRMAKLQENNLQPTHDNKSFNRLAQLLKIQESGWSYV